MSTIYNVVISISCGYHVRENEKKNSKWAISSEQKQQQRKNIYENQYLSFFHSIVLSESIRIFHFYCTNTRNNQFFHQSPNESMKRFSLFSFIFLASPKTKFFTVDWLFLYFLLKTKLKWILLNEIHLIEICLVHFWPLNDTKEKKKKTFLSYNKAWNTYNTHSIGQNKFKTNKLTIKQSILCLNK